MKKALALAALSVAAPVAMAQSVQVYGVLDAGLSRVTGLRGGTQNSLVSGIMDGSRLGFKASEDLGGGYRALFTLEHRLEVDTGGISNRPGSGSQVPDRIARAELLGLFPALQPAVTGVANNLGSTAGVNLDGRFWDRQIFLGLVTPVGAVLAGRQYTPGYEVAATFDTLETQSSLSAGQVGSFPPTVDIRISNAVAYRAVVGPVSAALMYGLKEGSASTGRFIGGNVIYKTDAFSVGAGYNTRENELGQKSLTTALVGASVAIGPGTLVGQAAAIQDDNPTGLSTIAATLTPLTGAATALVVQNAFVNAIKQDSRLYHVGYRLPIGPHKFYVAYSYLDDRRGADADTASYGAVYSYSFSKRTDLNVALTHFNNKNLAQAAPGQAGMLGGVTASAGKDANALAIGIRHRF
ncbi:MAG: porin [Ideonella sp.]|nr:porin [Ideonella sp.]